MQAESELTREFRVKVSVATTLAHAKGEQFVTHVKALPGIACVRRFSWWNLTGPFLSDASGHWRLDADQQ